MNCSTRNPAMSLCASQWALRELARRAGFAGDSTSARNSEQLPASVFYCHPEQPQRTGPAIIVIPCAIDAWMSLLYQPDHSLEWLSHDEVLPPGGRLPFDDPIPVLLWGPGRQAGRKRFAQFRADGKVIVNADIIAATFFMLSRWEETVVATRDEHGRFPAQAGVAYKQGLLDRPIVDEYALILREWLKVLLPRWEPRKRPFSVQLSHDVDHLRRFPDVMAVLRCAGGDLLKRRNLALAHLALSDTAAQVLSPETSSYVQGIRLLADLSRKHGLSNDVFYFMADGPGPFGGGYDPATPLVKRCIESVQRQGFEIGLHASYDAFGDRERLAEERRRLEATAGQPVRAVRQHYLRFRVPDTWRDFERVGLRRDSTMAYADHEGFRCGTCHAFRPFDLERNRSLDLWELPLVVMDGTLRGYRGLTPKQAEQRVLTLANRCESVEGVFTMLWHNSSLSREWLPWVSMYERLVQELAGRVNEGGIDL
ncbi:MAG: polysaccharide deacetylase family protein [bacterium]